jgi:hypothetical protein
MRRDETLDTAQRLVERFLILPRLQLLRQRNIEIEAAALTTRRAWSRVRA